MAFEMRHSLNYQTTKLSLSLQFWANSFSKCTRCALTIIPARTEVQMCVYSLFLVLLELQMSFIWIPGWPYPGSLSRSGDSRQSWEHLHVKAFRYFIECENLLRIFLAWNLTRRKTSKRILCAINKQQRMLHQWKKITSSPGFLAQSKDFQSV